MASSIRMKNGDLDFFSGESSLLTLRVDDGTSTLNIGNGKIKSTNTTFDSSQLFVTKQYVDNVARGLDVKESCRFATTANINFSNNVSSTDLGIDMDHANQSLVDGDRVLVKDQANSVENGIYRYNGSTLVRASDFNATSYITKGAFTFIFDGGLTSTNKNTGFAVSSLGNSDTFVLDGTGQDTNGVSSGRIIFTIISSQADNYKDAGKINTGKLDSAFLEISATGGLDSKTDGVGIKASGVVDAMIANNTISNTKLSTLGKVPFTTSAINGLGGAGVTVTNNTTTDNIVLGETVNFAIGSEDIEDGMISGLTGSKLVNGSVPNIALANPSVTVATSGGLQTTSATVALGGNSEISIADGGVTTAKILNGAVTNDKLQNNSLSIITNATSGLAGADTQTLGGTFNLSVASGGIDTQKIADNAVTNAKIATPNVAINTSAGLTGGGTVDLGGSLSLSIGDAGVTTTKIAAAAVTNDKLENEGFTLAAGSGLTGAGAIKLGETTHTIAVATGGIDNTHIASVSGVKLIAGTVPNSAMVNDGLTITPSVTGGLEVTGADSDNNTTVKLGANISVGVKDNGIVNTMIADSTISNSKLQNNSLTFTGADGILVNTAATTTNELGGSVALSIQNGSLTGDKMALDTITNSHLKNSEITLNVNNGLEITGNGTMTLGEAGSGSQTIGISQQGVTNTMLAGSITNGKLVNSAVTVNAGTGLTGGGDVALGSSITVNAAQDISPTAEVTFASITATSDPRLKANMTVLENCSGMVDQLNGYSFNWKNGPDTDKLQFGLNADEVEAVNPDLVKLGDNGFKSVNYNSVIAILLGAVKDLKREVAELKAAKA